MAIEALNIWLGIIASILGILMTLFSIRARRRKIGLRYGTWTINIINNIYQSLFKQTLLLEELTASIEGQSVQRLSITRIVLWNAGMRLLEEIDIARANPLTVKASKKVNIISAKVLKVTDPGINAKIILKDASTAYINFDYLEPHAGFIVDIIHTGNSSSAIKIEGSVKGFGRLSRSFLDDLSGISRFSNYISQRPRLSKWIYALFLAYITSFLIIALSEFHLFNYHEYFIAMNEVWAAEQIPIAYFSLILMTTLFVGQMIAVLWISLIRRPPSELREFEKRWSPQLSILSDVNDVLKK